MMIPRKPDRANRVRRALAWSGALAGLAAIAVSANRPVGQSPDAVTISIDANLELRPISPYIYGLAQISPEIAHELRLPLWRWGGNPNTRYNWEQGNAWNAARDWEFRNGNYSNTAPDDRKPSGVADKGIAKAKQAGVETLLTIPTMGWVSRSDDQNLHSVGVPQQGGPPLAPGSEAIADYDPSQNRQTVSIRSLPRKGKPFADPPDLKDNVVYQDEWVYHLTRKFGKAEKGGVRFYAMDNEPDLWASTHTDMHPVRPDYSELLSRFLDAATAIKDVDPTAQITGPVSWGWTGYFFSPRDQGADNYATHADRKAHGDEPFLPWFLAQVAAHDKKAGRRTLDYLDVHFYPQGSGIYGGQTDEKTNALRLRSVGALWDPEYKDESWIGEPVQLIPRLHQWVKTRYPGTKIALNEWNWGADNTLNGGLAVADVLGVLGREGVDMACYWVAPGMGTPGFFAYKLFRNADDAGHGFGDRAIAARSSAPEAVSCYGSLDSKTGQPVTLLINKLPEKTVAVSLRLTGGRSLRRWQAYRYSGANLKTIVHLPDISVDDRRARFTLPPYSLTLLRGE